MSIISTVGGVMPLTNTRLPDPQPQPPAEPPAALPSREGMVQGPPPPNPAMFVDPATGTVITQFYGANGAPSLRLESPRASAMYRAAMLAGEQPRDAASTVA